MYRLIMKRKWIQKAISVILTGIFFASFTAPLTAPQPVFAGENGPFGRQELADAAGGILSWCNQTAGQDAAQDLVGGVFAKNAGTTDSDWFVIAMSQMGLPGDYAGYLSALSKAVKVRYAQEGQLSPSKATEWHRIALAALACGGDPANIGGADLIADGVYNRGLVKPLDNQGNNGTIFALIALDSKNYAVPPDAFENREAILQKILDAQLPGGGFAQLGSSGDVDVTAMALMALAPYKEVCGEEIDRALSFLSSQQGAKGGFSSRGAENTESAAQVILALTALGIDPQSDGRFVKNDNTPVSRLMAMALPEGGFCHTEGGSPDWMASQQALCAISALIRQMDGKGSLYRFGGGSPDLKAAEEEPKEAQIPSEAEAPDQGETVASQTGPGEAVPAPGEEGASDLPALIEGASDPEDISGGADAEDVSGGAGAEDPQDPATQGPVDQGRGYGRTLGILAGVLGSVLCFWLGLKKATGRKKDAWLLAAVLLAGASLYLLADPQSLEQFRKSRLGGSTGDTVTVRIDCSTVWDNEEALDPALKEGGYIPEDGIFLEETAVSFAEGETAFDVLMRAAALEDLQVDYQGADSTLYGTAYIRGIQHLYEFSCGPLSGWTYSVNGEFPDKGSSAFPLSPGDRVEWLYTCDLGRYTDILDPEETP